MLVFAILSVFAYNFYYTLENKIWWDFKFCILSLPSILLIISVCKLLAPLKNALAFFGKHATNIYLIHNFIRIYAPKLVYDWRHCIVAFGVLLGISLGLSFIVELMKKVTRYERLIEKLYAK